MGSRLLQRVYAAPDPGIPAFTDYVTQPVDGNSGLAAMGLTTADMTTVINGDLLINDAYVASHGTLLEKYWVKGFVIHTADSRVKLSKSALTGRTFTSSDISTNRSPYDCIIHARSTSTNANSKIDLEYCDLIPVQSDINLSIASGERLGKLYRCKWLGGSDGLDYWSPAKPDVHCCYCPGYAFFTNDAKHASDGSHPYWAHPDMIQNSGSTGGEIKGNALHVYADPTRGDYSVLTSGGFPDGNYGSMVALTPSGMAISGIEIAYNWHWGGEVGVFFPYQPGGVNTGNSCNIHDNQHDLTEHPYGGVNHQFNRFSNVSGFGVTPDMIHDEHFMDDPSVPPALRGTVIPDPVEQTSSSQWIQSYNL